MMNKLPAVFVDTPSLGDTITSIPCIRKIYEAFDNTPITLFTSLPELFINHPIINKTLPPNKIDRDKYQVYRTFGHLAGKGGILDGEKVEFRHNVIDIRQYHAIGLGFNLTIDEMETDLYISDPKPLSLGNYIIIHPTKTWATRTWDQSKWQKLIDKINDLGVAVVAIGKNSSETGFWDLDKPIMEGIKIKHGINLLNNPNVSLANIRWMMNNEAAAVVTMDTGILHLAGTTDVNIIQLGSSIHPKYRAPYRKGKQTYKYTYVGGSCDIFCSSNMKYGVKEHGTIMGVPPLVNCLENKPTFECHPEVDSVYSIIKKMFKQTINE